MENKFRRVKKSDFKADSWIKPDALATCLDYWSTWMGKPDLDIGMPKKSNSLVGDGDGYGEAGDDEDAAPVEGNAQQRREGEIAVATDAMINSLLPYQRWAIYRRCGITTQWTFTKINLVDAIASAEESLIEKLKNNVATRNFW